MYYDMIVHPSRIELIERVFSPGIGKFREKKLASCDLDFKFDPTVIDGGKHYESFKFSLKQLLNPFRNDLTVLNIVIPHSFIQFKALEYSMNYTEFDDHINWEASKITTDVPEHYTYGTIFDNFRSMLIIAVMRKSVKDYFEDIMKDVYPDGLEFKTGCRYHMGGDSVEFVPIDKIIRKDFSPGTVIEGPAPKTKSIFISVSFLFMIAVLTVFYYFYPRQFQDTIGYWVKYAVQKIPYHEKIIKFQSDSRPDLTEQEIPAGPVTVTDTMSVAENTETSEEIVIPKEVTEPDEQPPLTVKKEPVTEELKRTPAFWDMVIEVTKIGADSLIFINHSGIVIYSSDNRVLSETRDLDTDKVYSFEDFEGQLSIEHKSFSFENSRLKSNFRKFTEVKDSYDIDPIRYYQNIFRIPAEKFYKFIKSLEENGVGFRKFIISRKNDTVTFTVYFG